MSEGKFVELGSGGGFLKDIRPDVLTSDILELDSNDLTFSALDMPFETKALVPFSDDRIIFHHIPDSAHSSE